MAEKRMFTQKIIDSDAFLDMPLSTQALYFHLNMRADDDGFVNNPKRIQRTVGASEDDLKLLVAKRFLICFENGVIVIKHWRMHNTLKSDRYRPTQYQEEYALLDVKDNKAYTEKRPAVILAEPIQVEPLRIQSGSTSEPQYSIDIDQNREEKNNKEQNTEIYKAVIDHLNEKAGTKYRPTTGKTQTLIRARLAEGFTLDDFKTVIDKKCAEWLNDPKMNQYLRPETLFSPKFEGYLNSKGGNAYGTSGSTVAGRHDESIGTWL